jgi:hypothetical protein
MGAHWITPDDLSLRLRLNVPERRVSAVPMCAVCHRPVDRLVETQETFLEKVVFVAHCHGQSERVEFNMREARDLDPSKGIAFARSPRRLAP